LRLRWNMEYGIKIIVLLFVVRCCRLLVVVVSHKTTMILFWLMIVCWSHGVMTVLETAQHTALMSVYESLGSSLFVSVDSTRHFQFFFFFFFFFLSFQDAPTQQCALDSMHRQIALALGWLVLVAMSFGCAFLVCVAWSDHDIVVVMQIVAQHPNVWVDSTNDWRLDGTHSIVRCCS
jgi:hypothetical protein